MDFDFTFTSRFSLTFSQVRLTNTTTPKILISSNHRGVAIFDPAHSWHRMACSPLFIAHATTPARYKSRFPNGQANKPLFLSSPQNVVSGRKEKSRNP